MQNYSCSPLEMFRSIWRSRQLILVATKRDILGRYRGSIFGILWSFLNPLFMLGLYTFIFSEIFKARWSPASESKVEFALVLFIGLIVYTLFAECINRAPSLILANTNYVKKVVFPLEILPFISFLTALFHALISLATWLIAYSFLVGLPHTTILYLPFLLIPYMFFILGCSWAFASAGVFYRDVSQIIGMLTTILMYLSPVLYPVNAIPATYRGWLFINPLTFVIEQVRNVLYWGTPPDFQTLCIFSLLMLTVAWLGFVWFQKTRKGFADVL